MAQMERNVNLEEIVDAELFVIEAVIVQSKG